MLRIALGVLLLAAAGLKLAGQHVSAVPQIGWFFALPPVQVAAAEWEIVLGIWLVSGAYPIGGWIASLCTFVAFAGVSSYLGWKGVSSCGCLGRIDASPWQALSIDLAVLAFLVLFHPDVKATKCGAPRARPHAARLVLATILVLGIIVSQLGSRNRGFNVAALEIAEGELQVGEVWETTNFKKSLAVTNRSDQELEVNGWATSCGCTGVEPQHLKLGPGQTRNVVVAMDLTARRKRPDTASEQFSVGFAPKLAGNQTNKLKSPAWTLRGTVRCALEGLRTIDLGRHSLLAQPLPPHVIRLTGRIPLSTVRAEVDPEKFVAQVRTSGPNEFELSIRPRASLPIGPLSSSVKLVPRLPNGDDLPELVLGVTGEIQADIQVFPEGGVALGAHRVGTTLEEVITLRSLTGRAFKVERTEADNSSIQIESLPPASSPTRTLLVRYRVAVEGTLEHAIRITVQGGDEETTIQVPVRAHGVAR